MIVGIGTDLIEVSRIRDSVEKYGKRFLNRVYTEVEQEYCEQFDDNKYLHYAARFAAKEAFSKAIGTGFAKGFKFKEIYIKNLPSGEPQAILDGDMKEKYGKYDIKVSLTHTKGNAVAYLIMEDNGKR